MPSLKKIKTVDRLADTLRQTPHYILLNFSTTSHKKLEEIRKKIRIEKESRIQIVKNSLLQIAARKAHKKELTDPKAIRGPSALLTLPLEWSRTLTTLYHYIKTDKTISFKIGLIDNVVYTEDQLTRIAQLPAKNVLLSTIIRTLKNPHTRFIFSMRWNMIRLVHVIKNGKRGE